MKISENERILIVDDDPQLGATIADLLTGQGFAADAISKPETIDEVLAIRLYDLAIVDLRMPRMNGEQVLQRIRETDPAIAVIMLTAHGTVEDVVRAFRTGAVDFLTKPAKGEEILRSVRSGLQRTRIARQARRATNQPGNALFAGILGSDAALCQQLDEACLAAKHDSAVLILGETGCGKDLLAEAIHRASPRAEGPFLTTVVGARPETLVQGELFGHVKSAFTGAAHAAHGLMKASHGGSLFLDEVGDISAGIQMALLRAIERKRFQPLGADHEVSADVRFISATNRDLEADVDAGRFRRDLYYRLSEYTIRLPPLRQRRGDIPMLISHFARQAVRSEINPPVFSEEAVFKLMAHDWPGNVRELKAEVTRAVHRCRSSEVSASECLINVRTTATNLGDDFLLPLEAAQDKFTVAYLKYWLECTNGNVREVARRASMHSQSVRRLLRKFDLRNGTEE